MEGSNPIRSFQHPATNSKNGPRKYNEIVNNNKKPRIWKKDGWGTGSPQERIQDLFQNMIDSAWGQQKPGLAHLDLFNIWI